MAQKLNSKTIIKKIEDNKRELNKLGVDRIGLFGSYAKKKEHKKSDIDFLVTFDKVNFDKYIELKFLLEKLFRKKIDLVIEKNLKPGLSYVKEEAIYAKT